VYYDGPAKIIGDGRTDEASVTVYVWVKAGSWDGVVTVEAGSVNPGLAELRLPDGRTGQVSVTWVTDRQSQGATVVGPSARFAGVGPPP
jgi:hypothetical protein